ncbi:MAG: radical SAM protein [Clostridia bacterium]|nr:radical SAM protein [Clostridia bacterium]
MGHINIPIFIPHLGCPNQCIFCNQRYISGSMEFDESMVEKQILDVLTTSSDSNVEIAFFGGSFTGIDRLLMIRLLDIAQKYINNGRVQAIRMSTRPDYISEEIIEILKKYTISCVELGIQSMNDEVLSFLKRGHTAEQTKRAISLLNQNKIPFVGQMMIGLPKATLDDELECANFICNSGAIGARIYPTLVFKQTELEKLTIDKSYEPLSLDEAIFRSTQVLSVFVEHNVPCIRIGLCESENLHSSDTFVAGPNHPSIGEMVKSELYFKIICARLDGVDFSRKIVIFCPKGATSQVIGNKKSNIIKLEKMYGFESIRVLELDNLESYNIEIKSKED